MSVLFRARRSCLTVAFRRLSGVSAQCRQQSSQAVQVLQPRKALARKDESEEMISLLRNGHTEWSSPGSAQFDFRSDVVTRPTTAMLLAIMKTTLQDDVYREDYTTTSLENHVANLAGHEAGLFVLSGTMANQLALRTHLNHPPESLLCDARSHIIHWEAGGLANTGAMIQSVAPQNGEFLTLEDIKAKIILTDDVHKSPTTVISLENTISGLVHPLSENRRIATWARQKRLKLHLDGARLWEAVATGAGSVRDHGECFDSVSVDFSKGLGAPMGAMILGNKQFITRARRIRKGMGGGMRQSGVLSAAAWAALDNLHKLPEVHRLATTVADMWTSRGGRLRRRTETNLVWIDPKDDEVFRKTGIRYGIKVDGCRLVLHHQISREAIHRLGQVFDNILASTLAEEPNQRRH